MASFELQRKAQEENTVRLFSNLLDGMPIVEALSDNFIRTNQIIGWNNSYVLEVLD